jgi:hypothetical protein
MSNEHDRFVVALADASIWLVERQGDEMRGRLVTRVELATTFPRLYAALLASNNSDAPFIVMERPR